MLTTYSIEEVADKLSISKSKLRYYEKHELIKNIERDANNNRRYKDKDIETINMVICMRRLGIPIHTIKEKFKDERINELSVHAILMNHKEILRQEIMKYEKYIEEIDKKLNVQER